MKFSSPVYSAASGSIGGLTYSHNRGGLYTRTRAIPTNPNTAAQQSIRGQFGTAAIVWKALTQAQQDGWNTYAANTPVTNPLGASIYLTGQQWFNAALTFQQYTGGAVAITAPPTPGLAELHAPTSVAISEATQEITATVDATDGWAVNGDGRLSVQASRPLSAGTNSVNHPLRLAAVTSGDTVSPPTSLATTAVPFPVTQGDKVVVRFRAQEAGNRLSQPNRQLITVGA